MKGGLKAHFRGSVTFLYRSLKQFDKEVSVIYALHLFHQPLEKFPVIWNEVLCAWDAGIKITWTVLREHRY